VSERSKERDWKSRMCRKVHRGFKSLPLRLSIRVYPCLVELLERDGPLAALVVARTLAAQGNGRVVFVTGEPGIGKTSLVTEFVQALESEARVLFGGCDDLSIPRPLGPIRDLIGYVSTPLEEALFVGAAPHEIQRLLIDELELRPRPTVLVLEDVHWADDATLDLNLLDAVGAAN
jgi:predicted ATPase